jgi:uncharacterized membrane protein
MSAADVTLGLCVILAGLWSGLLLTLTTILHPMFRRLDGPAFALEMRRFLPVARRSPTNWIIVIGLVLAPVAALIALRAGTATFVLIALGLAACVVGPLLVSRFLAEPNYDVILAWDPDALPADWQRVQRRYFRLNWVRAVITWAAFALFAAAAYLSWA